MLLNWFYKKRAKKRIHTILGLSLASLISLTLMISGCAMVGPDYVKPTAAQPEKWLEADNPQIKSEMADFTRWWTGFNDPILNRLVESAYQQNLPLQISGLRILEARAQLGIAIGFQYPQSQEAFGQGSVTQLSNYQANARFTDKYYFDYQVGIDAAWELDFWGKFRRAVQSGMANLEASIADYDDILVALTAEVARTYIIIRTFEERLAVAHENKRIQKRSLEIAEVRFKAGAVTELDVAQARALLRSTEATIPTLESDVRQAKNALAILLGKLPGEIDDMLGPTGRIPEVPAEVAVGIPAELLRRRPDIRFAERALAAQSALIGFAKADLFPHFSLFGTIGMRAASKVNSETSNNSGFNKLFNGDSLTYFAGPSINWDLFNYGRITNRVRVEDARFQELVVNYQNVVLEAAREVEDAMIGFLRRQDAVAFLADGVNASKRSVDLSLIQYREGLVDYQRVLDTQRFLTEQQDTLVATAGSVVSSLIAMYKALGGGWEIREGKDFVPDKVKAEMDKRTDWGNLLAPQAVQTVAAEETRSWFNRPDW